MALFFLNIVGLFRENISLVNAASNNNRTPRLDGSYGFTTAFIRRGCLSSLVSKATMGYLLKSNLFPDVKKIFVLDAIGLFLIL